MQQESLPYNFSNVAISVTELQGLLDKYGHSGKLLDINTYRTSFVHRSYCTRKNENFVKGNTNCPPGCLPLQEESNERLEFLGDAVVNLIVGNYLFKRYPDENEGVLTRMRTKLVNGNMMASLSESALDLGKHFIISKQIDENNGRSNKRILEDCFESFVGAMFVDDGSLQHVERWLVNLIEENVDFAHIITSVENHKDVMIKSYQHKFGYVPRFFEQGIETCTGVKMFRVCLKDRDGKIIAQASGATKKIAENECAKVVLLTL
jgi:ribonuclease-3